MATISPCHLRQATFHCVLVVGTWPSHQGANERAKLISHELETDEVASMTQVVWLHLLVMSRWHKRVCSPNRETDHGSHPSSPKIAGDGLREENPKSILPTRRCVQSNTLSPDDVSRITAPPERTLRSTYILHTRCKTSRGTPNHLACATKLPVCVCRV